MKKRTKTIMILLMCCIIAMSITGCDWIQITPTEETTAKEPATEEPTTKEEPTEETTTEEKTEEPTEEPDIIKKYDNDIVVAASMALDQFITDYDISLAPQRWTLAKFDDTETTVIATTDISYKGENGKYIYVGTLNINDSGKVESAKPHYLEVNGEVLGDDGYCTDVFDKVKSLEQ